MEHYLNDVVVKELIICVYALNRNKHAKSYSPSMFQTCNLELLSPKIETVYKYESPKRDHNYL